MSTIRTLAKKYNCSEDVVSEMAEIECGFIPLSYDHDIPKEKVEQLEKVLQNAAPTPTTRPRPTSAPTPKPASASTTRPRPTSVPAPKPASTPISVKDVETRELLSRDYIIFTLTAMEKPGLYEVMRKMLEKGMPAPHGRIVVLSDAITILEQDAMAEKDAIRAGFLQRNLQILQMLQSKQHLLVLEGAVAEEGVILGRFIRENRKPETSILVLGKNMSLNTSIYNMNEAYIKKDNQNQRIRNQNGPSDRRSLYVWNQYCYHANYIPVEECSFSAKGNLYRVDDDNAIFGPDIDEKFKYVNKVKYEIDIQVTDVQEEKIEIEGNIPGGGDIAYTYHNGEWTPIQLIDVIHKGGAEGGIYALSDDSLCAKILKPESITARKMKKLELLCKGYKDIFGGMIGRDNSVIRRIAWPQEMLYASQDVSQPIGYIMRRFNGLRGLDNITSRTYRAFVNEEKENQIVAAISLTELVRFLHENNVILCDINRGNIMYDNNHRAYLVDLDSAQVTDPTPILDDERKIAHYTCYPANVAAPQFLSPEHINDTSFTFVHSIKDDVWSLQYMIFLLLTMCGAYMPFPNPETTPEGRADIAEGNYIYPKYYNANSEISENDPRYYMHCIISRFPQELRTAFYNAFNGRGRRFSAKDRCEAKVWMRWLVKYYESLPARIEQDPENGKYRPESIWYGGDTVNINMRNGNDEDLKALWKLLGYNQ